MDRSKNTLGMLATTLLAAAGTVAPFASHEWVVRASWLDLQELGGTRQAEVSAGVNLYASRRSRGMLHLQHTEVEGGEDLDILLLRLQAGF